MIKVGKRNLLTVSGESSSGYYLKSEDSDEEAFLPPALASSKLEI